MAVKRSYALSLPVCLKPEDTLQFRKHVAGLAGEMVIAAKNYAKKLPTEDCSGPKEIGSACIAASFILSLDMSDEQAQSLNEALVATLLLNEPSSGIYQLATLPPLNERPL